MTRLYATGKGNHRPALSENIWSDHHIVKAHQRTFKCDIAIGNVWSTVNKMGWRSASGVGEVVVTTGET